MIVCLCEGLSERVIEAAVREGACTMRAVAECTRAGTSCGSCAADIRKLLRRARSVPAPQALQAVAK